MSNEQKEKQIRERAYALYLARNGKEGSPVDDWVRAEQELSDGLQKGQGVAERAVAGSSSSKRRSAYPAEQERTDQTSGSPSVRKRY